MIIHPNLIYLKIRNYEAPHYVTVSLSLLLELSYIKTFSLVFIFKYPQTLFFYQSERPSLAPISRAVLVCLPTCNFC